MIEVEIGALTTKKKKRVALKRKTKVEETPKPPRIKKLKKRTRNVEDDAPRTKLKPVKKTVTGKKTGLRITAQSTKDDRRAELERLKAEAEAVIERIPVGNSEDAEQLEQYRHMFDKLVSIATILEDNITGNRTSRDVYPLMQTYNQIREVIADMRALRDVGAMGAMLNDEVLAPMMQSISQDTVDLYQNIERMMRSHLDSSQADALKPKIDSFFSKAATAMQRSYETALEKSQTVMGG